jgi:predicted permease
MIVDVRVSGPRLPPEGAVSFRRDLLARLRATPGVEAAAEVVILPLTNADWNNRMWMDGSDPAQAHVVYRNMIGPDYFVTMGTPLIAGREFDEHDVTSGSKVAVVNDAFTRQFGAGRTMLGQHVWIEATPFDPSTRYEIVGVVKNTKYLNVREPFRPQVYVPLAQDVLENPSATVAVRPRAHTDRLPVAVRHTLDSVGRPMQYSFRSFDTVVENSMRSEQLMAALSAPFGGLGILLTALGLYGVISYTVAQRTREIGIRIALGAPSRRVALAIWQEAVGVLFVGLVVGTALTIGVGQLTGTLLFGLHPYDVGSLTFAVVLVTVVALFAACAPARRATTVDPALALRQQ